VPVASLDGHLLLEAGVAGWIPPAFRLVLYRIHTSCHSLGQDVSGERGPVGLMDDRSVRPKTEISDDDTNAWAGWSDSLPACAESRCRVMLSPLARLAPRHADGVSATLAALVYVVSVSLKGPVPLHRGDHTFRAYRQEPAGRRAWHQRRLQRTSDCCVECGEREYALCTVCAIIESVEVERGLHRRWRTDVQQDTALPGNRVVPIRSASRHGTRS